MEAIMSKDGSIDIYHGEGMTKKTGQNKSFLFLYTTLLLKVNKYVVYLYSKVVERRPCEIRKRTPRVPDNHVDEDNQRLNSQ